MSKIVKVSGVPQESASELERIHRRDGELNALAVLTEARQPGNPLHKHFEWDDSRAAEEHRINQARDLIRRVKVTVITQKKEVVTVRAYVSDREIKGEGDKKSNVYRPAEEVAASPDFRAGLLATIVREIESLQRKYAAYEDLFDAAIATVTAKKQQGAA